MCTASSIRRSWVTSSSVPGYDVERLLQLLDRGQVEVVGRLVEHEQVDPARLQQRQRRPGALARRERRGRPQHVRRRRSPNLASSVRTSAGGRSGHRGAGTRRAAARRRGTGPRAWSISPTTTPGPSAARARRPAAAARAARRAACDLPEPFGPVIATRSAQSICRSTGPSVNVAAADDGARAACATTAPARGAAAISIRSSHSLRGSSTTSSRSISRSVWRRLGGLLLRRLAAELGLTILSLSVALRRALRTPFSIQARCMRARASSAGRGVGVLLVLLARVPAGDLALVQVGVVAAAVDADLLLGAGRARRPG